MTNSDIIAFRNLILALASAARAYEEATAHYTGSEAITRRIKRKELRGAIEHGKLVLTDMQARAKQ